MAEQGQEKDQKTEDATPQRLRKAREDGQIGFSSELVSAVILTMATGFFWFAGAWFFETITGLISRRLTSFELVLLDPRMIIRVIIEETSTIGAAVLALILPVAAVAATSGLLQTNFNISSKPLELKLDKLSVIEGFKRMFSSRAAVRGVLALAKATVIIAITIFVGWGRIAEITTTGASTSKEMLGYLGGLLLHTSVAVAATITVLSLIDLGFQKWKHLQDMKMSRQDLKDEQKMTEGDPMMRARIKQLQAEMGRQRMFAEIPKADVVVTNPTHFAVALKYDRATMDAPVVVAKGADHIAKKIIQIAKENGVAVVERKPVARFLFKNVEIGKMIPFELYQAVAEILNFVNRMRSSI
ncbi:flagellar biosynthesis protein FlhB [Rhodopirellula sp. MGV]|uniref:flagellar biosynthesis protein FlhB n=1 Tax=Rhodopirellula sp. MGV TaxID=2023130 RepID=UPI000B9636A4|nr:flagellar biosynthesis protein FlhB [Rhodopirellula sp. MGV]OYP32284.1 flagellar biosynthesis protein FlhB [Rhodopirellula sp. MGV]PNY35931.1 flagellar biosynthesis protein FlhB [Rhodopirellula baltica]